MFESGGHANHANSCCCGGVGGEGWWSNSSGSFFGSVGEFPSSICFSRSDQVEQQASAAALLKSYGTSHSPKKYTNQRLSARLQCLVFHRETLRWGGAVRIVDLKVKTPAIKEKERNVLEL